MTPVYFGALLTLAIFVLGNIGMLIWHISRFNTLVEVISDRLDQVAIVLKDHEKERYTKADSIRDLAIINRDMKTMWERIDKLQGAMN